MKLISPTVTDIFDKEELNQLVIDFSGKFGFCAYILDTKGKVIVDKPYIPSYCKKHLENKIEFKKCMNDTKLRLANLSVTAKECWAGYRKILIPVKFFDKVIAYWVTCGIEKDVDDRVIDTIIKITDSFLKNFLKTYEKWWNERELIVNIFNELVSEKDYELLLEKIVKATTNVLKSDRTTLFIYDGEKLISRIAEGIDQEIALKLGEGIAGKCALKREVIVVDKVNKDTGVKVIVRDYEIRNLICAPIIFKRKLLGVVESFNKEGSFTNRDMKLISYLADAAAIALNNAQTFIALERLSIIDPLTQLYNRSYFFKSLEKEITRLNRYEGYLSIMFIDIDDFKQLNDKYGHTVGDIVLKEMANLIRSSLRDVDIAARFGGEEFVIMLPNTNKEGALSTAKRLQEMLKTTPLAGHIISASIGIASYTTGLNAKSLIDRADKAMYRVKKTEKGKISFW
ncbi:MAG: diguanylate cyclase [Proteobacteria bacterium]|nr:diguanylate cyclase [Pseudomonadota bacterium]